MRHIEYGHTFKKDLRRMMKRGLKIEKLEKILDLLVHDKPLLSRNKSHLLTGEWSGFLECHIEPDWLLIYDLSDPTAVSLHRTGSHADLFE